VNGLPLPGVNKRKKLYTHSNEPFLMIPENDEAEKKEQEKKEQEQEQKKEKNMQKNMQEKKIEEKKEKIKQEKNNKEKEQENMKIIKTYSYSEDGAILDFIVNNSVYKLRKSDMLWKEMKEQGLCPDRSWMGMKTRFLRSILPNLAKYGLSHQLLLASDRKTGEKPVFHQPENMKEAKMTKKYTTLEDQKIITYIIKNQRFKHVKGQKLWKLMEERKVVTDRSWLSMMRRFNNFIVKHITLYNLNEGDLEKFLAIRK
jgi:hypothetical protein